MVRKLAIIIFIVLSVMPTAKAGFGAATAFDKKCSGCHTIGGGVLKGPDLKGVSERRQEAWLIQFIKSSASLIESGDADAVKLYNEFEQRDMPDQRLSDGEIIAILNFVKGGIVTTTQKQKSALESTESDILLGKNIFMGIKPLANGGPACISCHHAGNVGALGGGTLAKDLSMVYSAYKDGGLSIALEKLAFPVMESTFANKPLTEEEIFALKSFFYSTDKTGLKPGNYQKKFLFLALGGTVVALGVIDFTWRRRRKKSVRRHGGGIR